MMVNSSSDSEEDEHPSLLPGSSLSLPRGDTLCVGPLLALVRIRGGQVWLTFFLVVQAPTNRFVSIQVQQVGGI